MLAAKSPKRRSGDVPKRDAVPRGELALTGPRACGDPAREPVRGDLAHIRLAGRCFVPHYAVPLPRVVAAPGVTLRAAARAEAAPVATLTPGTRFEVLDIAGEWAWGQCGERGPVGYLPVAALRAR